MNIHQELALRDELAKPTYAEALAERAYAAIAAAINAPQVVANPDKTPRQVPIRLSLKMVMSQVPPAEMVKAYGLPGFVADVKTAIDNQDREYLSGLLTIAVAAGAISEVTAAGLVPLLTATETVEPPATIEGPSIAEMVIGAVVTPDDVATMHHRYLGG
jgi:hypothetical protein